MTKLREVMDKRKLSLTDVAFGTELARHTIWRATQGLKTNRSTRLLIAGYLGMPQDAVFPQSAKTASAE